MQNGLPGFVKLRKGRIRGKLREDLQYLLPVSAFEDLSTSNLLGSEILKRSLRRDAFVFPLKDGRRIFIKKDRTKGWLESMKYLFTPSRGRREWLVANELKKRGIRVPEPLGWMETRRSGLVRESYYISEAHDSRSLYEEGDAQEGTPETIARLAAEVRRLHDAGLLHKDFHAGNFLRNGDGFSIIDLHGAKVVDSVSLSERLWMLAHLFHSLKSHWREEEFSRFLESYFEVRDPATVEKEDCLKKICRMIHSLERRHLRSRTKRCLKESTEFVVERRGGEVFYRRREISLERLRSLVKKHCERLREEPSRLVKNSCNAVISEVTDGGERFCIKQFRYPSLWSRIKNSLRHSKTLRAWIAGNGLRVRGFSSPKVLGAVEMKWGPGTKEGFLVMESLTGGEELDRYLSRGSFDLGSKRRFVRAFAVWLSQLHCKGIYHGDMKTCNVWVHPENGGWEFYLLDLEDTCFDTSINERRLFRNLLQLNSSTPDTITKTDRLRFLRQYLINSPLKIDRKGLTRKLIRETEKRGIVYVGISGLVEKDPCRKNGRDGLGSQI